MIRKAEALLDYSGSIWFVLCRGSTGKFYCDFPVFHVYYKYEEAMNDGAEENSDWI